jgi:hypothetical protein
VKILPPLCSFAVKSNDRYLILKHIEDKTYRIIEGQRDISTVSRAIEILREHNRRNNITETLIYILTSTINPKEVGLPLNGTLKELQWSSG